MRIARVRRADAARRPRRHAERHARFLGRARFDDGRLARNALLEQQLGRLDAPIRMESVDHQVARQDVGDGDQAHSLVVREVGLDDDSGAGRRCCRQGRLGLCGLARGVVHRVVEPERSRGSFGREAPEVLRGCRRIHQCAQRRRVGRHDELVRESALEPQAGHAKRLVLVVAEPVDEVVGRLRDAPGHVAIAGVFDLALHRHAARSIEQRPRIRPHHEERHQVLEHRRAPGNERRNTVDADDESAEVEPVALRHVALGDGEEARQARLGGEQVVVGAVEATRPGGVGQSIADREQLARRSRRGGEVHPVRQRLCAAGRDRSQRAEWSECVAARQPAALGEGDQ